MTDRDRELRAKAATFRGWDATRSGHNTHVVERAGGVFLPECKTCHWRPPEFITSRVEAELEESGHHFRVANGAEQVRPRSAGLGPAINHAREMAARETTPPNEAAEWTRLADEMQRQQKVISRVKAPPILDGQEALFATEGEAG